MCLLAIDVSPFEKWLFIHLVNQQIFRVNRLCVRNSFLGPWEQAPNKKQGPYYFGAASFVKEKS